MALERSGREGDWGSVVQLELARKTEGDECMQSSPAETSLTFSRFFYSMDTY